MDAWQPDNQTILGAVIGILATLVLGGLGRWMFRRRKYLDWWIDYDEAVIRRHHEGIQVSFDGDPLEAPRLIGVTVANTGNQSIAADEMKT